MSTKSNFEEALAKFIAIPTIAYDRDANISAIAFLKSILNSLNFEITIEGESPYFQPVIVAKYKNKKTNRKVVLYGHYDVEKIKEEEKWDTPPFQLTEKNGRYYGRGIADNKGILIARLFALKEMFESGEELPNILWIIQGEEEIEGKTPFEVIPKQYLDFGAKFYLEETGMYKDEMPLILFLPKIEKHPEFLDDLNQSVYKGQASFENRKLNKFSECPFLINIPEDSYYLAFGPNDSFCNIHKENESLDIEKLINHQKTFKEFIRWIYTYNYT